VLNLMLADIPNESWYALFVVTGEEEKVKERLKFRFSDEFKILVPRRRLKERRNGVWTYTAKTLFPGYILINGDSNKISGCDFNDIPKLIRPLKSGSDMLRIDQEEIAVLSRLICNSEIIDFSSILIERGKVKVIDGPLLSMEGIILSVDHRKGRAKIRLDFLGDERTVELGVSILRPVG
jgi:transcriptional antiterminator NusG